MTLNISHESLHDRIVGAPLKAIHDLDGILRDLEYGWSIEKFVHSSPLCCGANNLGHRLGSQYKLAGITYNVTGIDLESVFPCCVCLDWSAEPYIQVPFPNNPFLNDHPPCDDDVAKFQGTTMVVYFRDGGHDTINISQDHSGLGSILPSNEELKVSSVLRLVLQNAFQAIYNMSLFLWSMVIIVISVIFSLARARILHMQ
ncbi:hypothetical protein F5146DRAFT_524901 [Armillaria mellea]|nr:hypothetical protein F5146DRAFT_524901 [Armillaria mellea]